MSEIQAFLEEKGYKFGNDWHAHYADYEQDNIAYEWSGSYPEILADCLDHWLTGELGRHWKQVWGSYFWKFLDSDLVNEIDKAIEWHEQLIESEGK